MNHKIRRHPGTPCAQNPADWLDSRHRDHTARVCRTCPALARCAAEAARIRPDYGMWAGIWIDGDFTGKQHLLGLPHPHPSPTQPTARQNPITPPTAKRAARIRRVGALCTAGALPAVATLITARASGHCEIMAPGCTYTQTAVFSRRRGSPRSPLSSPAEALAACANCIDLIEHTALPTAFDLGYLISPRSCASTVALWWRQSHWVHLDSQGRLRLAGAARLTPTA